MLQAVVHRAVTTLEHTLPRSRDTPLFCRIINEVHIGDADSIILRPPVYPQSTLPPQQIRETRTETSKLEAMVRTYIALFLG
jgi:hypothetical protein